MREGWRTYSSERLSLSFSYPSAWGDISVGEAAGTSGIQYQGSFSAAPITFGGNSPDYVGRGGGAQLYDFFEYQPSGAGRFKVRFAQDKYQDFSAPAEIRLPGGASAIIASGQEEPQVFDRDDRIAYVNLPGRNMGPDGIAARYRDIPSGSIAEFDEFISSIRPLE